MANLVIGKAKNWGFACELDSKGRWQILPQQQEETWKLTQTNSRWVLSVKDIPQLYLPSEEAIVFLEGRYRYSAR